MKNKVTTIWKGGMEFLSDNPSGKNLIMDTDVQGSDKRVGLSPKALMLSSLAGCSGLDVVSILNKMRVKDYALEIAIEAELTEEHPKYYSDVEIDYYFKGNQLPKAKIDKAVSLSVEKYCGVMEMFRKFANINYRIHIEPK